MDDLIAILENTSYDVRSYSGRGMYGKECLGITINRRNGVGDFVAEVLESINDLDDPEFTQRVLGDFAEILRGMCVDSMGLGQIIYFPDISYSEEDPSDDDED